jgi:hypothetical protein
MPVTAWSEVVGHKCQICGLWATHIYGDIYICCDCHTGGGGLVTQEEARIMNGEDQGDASPDEKTCPYCDEPLADHTSDGLCPKRGNERDFNATYHHR